MAGFNANAFRNELSHGGARSTLFEVTLTFPGFVPGGAAAGNKFSFMCKAAQIPGMTLGLIEIPYFGRTVKVPGDRTFEDWNVTIINDEDYLVRNAFEAWNDGIARLDHDTNSTRAPGAAGVNGYVADLTVKQYGKGGQVVKQYQIKNAFPFVVDPIELSWENRDQIEEFGVTFAYEYFVTRGFDAAGTLGSGTFSERSNVPG